MSPASGLRVLVPALEQQSSELGLEILDQRMRLKKRASSGEEIPLDPGVYVVSVACPDGVREVKVAEVKPGKTTVVQVDWRPARFGGIEARAGIQGAKATGGRPPQGFAQRFLEFSAEEGKFTPLNQTPAMEVTDYRSERGVLEVSMTLSVRGDTDQLRFVQLAAEGHTITAALPLALTPESTQCLLFIAVSKEKLDVHIELGGSGEAGLVGQFVAGGELPQVADLPSSAEALLFDKMTHPLGAAIGGYALLRLGQLERLHNWPANLAKWFSWLPDGPVILGEQALRNRQPNEALVHFGESVRRGLPVFTDGYSMLLERLRDFARGADVSGVTSAMMEHAAVDLKRIGRWAPFVDFGELLLTLRTTDHAEITRPEKWKLFRIPLGKASASEDFWTDPRE